MTVKANRLFFSIIVLFALSSSVFIFILDFGRDEDPKEQQLSTAPVRTTDKQVLSDTTVVISGIPVDIRMPRTWKADMLVLPGWNYERTRWCNYSSLCHKAQEEGYRLILPEMGKSIYASSYFTETRKDWLKFPTLTWVCDTMIPFLQKNYGVLKKENRNYVVGLSTGARGVVLVSNRSQIFSGAGALSGDYDQTTMRTDNLCRGIYGEYDKFKERWEKIDNPTQQIPQMQTPIYLGHGRADKIVPFEQTQNFYNNIKKLRPDLKVIFHPSDTCGHNFYYWNSEVDAMLNFFQQK